MDTRPRPSVPRTYEDFQPTAEWISEDTAETLLIRLPGYTKEQLKVQIDNHGKLRTSGEHPIEGAGGRWSRFQTEHRIPENCEIRGIRARFDNNCLYVSLPKVIKEQPKPEPEPEKKPVPPPVPEPEPEPESKLLQEPKQEVKKESEDEVKEKEAEEKEHDDEGKEKDGSGGVMAPLLEKGRRLGAVGLAAGFRRPNQMVVNMVVAVIVLVMIGMYVANKLRSGAKDE